MKLLVVDDSRMARRMVIKTLTELLSDNDEIIEGVNGEEAITLYKKHQPSLVFLDLTMPVMDGFEALDKIKEFDQNACVVVVSADIQKTSMDKVRFSGALDFVKKPIDSRKMEQIFQKINKA